MLYPTELWAEIGIVKAFLHALGHWMASRMIRLNMPVFNQGEWQRARKHSMSGWQSFRIIPVSAPRKALFYGSDVKLYGFGTAHTLDERHLANNLAYRLFAQLHHEKLP
jgi:hypothetical protein